MNKLDKFTYRVSELNKEITKMKRMRDRIRREILEIDKKFIMHNSPLLSSRFTLSSTDIIKLNDESEALKIKLAEIGNLINDKKLVKRDFMK